MLISFLLFCSVIVDTVMMMSSYSDAVVIRHPQPGAVAVSVLICDNSKVTIRPDFFGPAPGKL